MEVNFDEGTNCDVQTPHGQSWGQAPQISDLAEQRSDGICDLIPPNLKSAVPDPFPFRDQFLKCGKMQMDPKTLKRNLNIHRVFANEMLSQFQRLWCRELQNNEIDVIESSTLCLSFMRLESICNELARATRETVADETFAFMSSSVESGRSEIVDILSKSLGKSNSLHIPAHPNNLLALEEVVCDAIS